MKTEENIISEINKIESNLTEDKLLQLKDLQNKLKDINDSKLQGYLIRSRANWTIEGEKPSHFFCGLEKNNYITKTIYKVQKENGE